MIPYLHVYIVMPIHKNVNKCLHSLSLLPFCLASNQTSQGQPIETEFNITYFRKVNKISENANIINFFKKYVTKGS